MKKSYSSLNLLRNALSRNEKNSFFRQFIPKKREITVEIPYYDYIRGKVFVEDFSKIYEEDLEEINTFFDFDLLLFILYEDLLKQVRKGVAHHEQIVEFLTNVYENYYSTQKKEKRIMKTITPTLLRFETVEEERTIRKVRMAYITIRMNENEILRGEILLHDLQPFMGLSLTVEKVITLLYLNFIEKVKTDGNNQDVYKFILTYLENR